MGLASKTHRQSCFFYWLSWVVLNFCCVSSALAGTLNSAQVLDENRLVLNFSTPFHYHAFYLHNPERLVLDFQETDIDTIEKTLSKLSFGQLPIRTIRVSVNPQMVLRVVLDLTQPENFKVTTLQPSHYGSWRLMIEQSHEANQPTRTTFQPSQRAVMPISSERYTQQSAPAVHVATPAASPSIPHSMPSNSSSTSTFGRAQIASTAVTRNIETVGGDVMIPVYSNQDSVVYGDVMGNYANDKTYVASPGMGFRQVYNNQIWGAYLFGDYEEVSDGENYWNFSPGIEWISPQWDTHLNGYFPTEKTQATGSTTFASDSGNYNYVTFEQGTHNQYDELITPVNVIGNGVDAELGYSFDMFHNQLRSRAYIGADYYQAPSNTNASDITGITAGFSQAISPYATVSIFNAYDKVSHYNFGIGLTLNLGGQSNVFSNNVHDRLLDPVQRHVGIIDTGAGNYDQAATEYDGLALQYDNVYFVSPNGVGNGTYGSSMSLTQSNLDAAYAQNSDGSRLYLQGGTNAIYTVNSSSATQTTLDSNNDLGLYVHDNQNFYGRSDNYKQPASSDTRPEIDVADGYNGFIMQGGENSFNNLNILGASLGRGTGILSYNTSGNSTLNVADTNISQFNTGLYGYNNGSGTLIINTTNATLNNNTARGSGVGVYGMNVTNTGTGNLTVNTTNSQFNNNSATGTGNSLTQAFGLSATNNSTGDLTVNATNSQFNNNTATGNWVQVFGMNLVNQSTGDLNMISNNSMFNSNSASGSGSSNLANGLYAENNNSGAMDINTNYSQFNNNSSNADAFGMEAIIMNSLGPLTIDINHSQFNGNHATTFASGVYFANISPAPGATLTATATNSEFNNNTGATGYGVYAVEFNPGYARIALTRSDNTATGNSTGDYYIIE